MFKKLSKINEKFVNPEQEGSNKKFISTFTSQFEEIRNEFTEFYMYNTARELNQREKDYIVAIKENIDRIDSNLSELKEYYTPSEIEG